MTARVPLFFVGVGGGGEFNKAIQDSRLAQDVVAGHAGNFQPP